MNNPKPTRRKRADTTSSHNDFYETMPIAMGSRYVYRQDVIDFDGADAREEALAYDATIRRVAIITLVVSALVALAAGFLLAQGLSAVRDALPVNHSASSLEL